MIKQIFSLAMVLILLLTVGCSSSSEPEETGISGDIGKLILKLIDAPIDSYNITGVFITINEIQVHNSTVDDDANWEPVKVYDHDDENDPNPFDLLELTDGNFVLLGEFELTAGHYNQIRFMLDIQDQDHDPPTTPGCYVEFNDDPEDTAPLFVPSGGQSGYKAVGAFEVPVDGEVEVTVDFDVDIDLHSPGQGNNQKYILHPTLHLIVDS